MAWIRESVSRRTGAILRSVQWYDRTKAVRSKALGAVSADDAERERRRVEVEEEERVPRKVATGIDKALEAFLNSRRAKGAAEDTITFYREKLERVFDAMGGRALPAWRPSDLEAFFAKKRAPREDAEGKVIPGWSPRYVAMHLIACRTFLKWARKRNLAIPDFAADVEAPKRRPTRPKVFTAEEVAAILTYARETSSPLEPAVALAAYAGLSRHDLHELTWEEVDLKANLIRHSRLKTGEGDPLPIRPELRAVLDRHRATHGLVCRGMPADKSAATQALHRLQERAGVETSGWHRFRHTYATLVFAATKDQATVAALLQHRHGSSETAKYVHTDAVRMSAGAAAAAKAIAGA